MKVQAHNPTSNFEVRCSIWIQLFLELRGVYYKFAEFLKEIVFKRI